MHLIADTNFYLEQIEICTSTNDNANEEASPAAKTMLRNNDFPDERIEGAPSNSLVPQPASKGQLSSSLEKIKEEMNRLATLIAAGKYKGKTKVISCLKLKNILIPVLYWQPKFRDVLSSKMF